MFSYSFSVIRLTLLSLLSMLKTMQTADNRKGEHVIALCIKVAYLSEWSQLYTNLTVIAINK